MVPLFRTSEGVLANKMVTLANTVLLLQQMSIIPRLGVCCTCDMPCNTEYKRNGTWLYWPDKNNVASPNVFRSAVARTRWSATWTSVLRMRTMLKRRTTSALTVVRSSSVRMM